MEVCECKIALEFEEEAFEASGFWLSRVTEQSGRLIATSVQKPGLKRLFVLSDITSSVWKAEEAKQRGRGSPGKRQKLVSDPEFIMRPTSRWMHQHARLCPESINMAAGTAPYGGRPPFVKTPRRRHLKTTKMDNVEKLGRKTR